MRSRSFSTFPVRFSMFGVLLAMLLATLLPLAASAPASAFGKPFRFTITGEGVVVAVPDMAHISISVHTREKSAAEALRANTQAMRRVFGTLKQRFAIAEKDMATTGLEVRPIYFTPRDDNGRPKGPARLVAYEVNNRLSVRVRDLDKLGALIDAVVQDGANRLDGIAFGFSNRRKLLDEARRKAVADAMSRAKLYADAVGFSLGPVVEVRESGGPRPVPVRRVLAAKAMAMEAAPVPVARGEQEVRVQVSITWEAQSR